MEESIRAAMLALVQGLTEFLPISSSAHLILPAQLFGWPDQGLPFDVAVHLGSLLAVLAYFRKDLWVLTLGSLSAIRQGQMNTEARLVFYLLVATVPVGVVGVLLNDWVEGNLRSIPVIAMATIGFGILLAIADRRTRAGTQVNLAAALWIGVAQVLALVPGTSRSGITITAGLFCGLSRESAARFSFLLSIPVILAASVLLLADLGQGRAAGVAESVDWSLLALGIVVSGLSAYATIAWFLALVDRLGFLPFVLYRCLLGIFLLVIWMN